MTLVNDRPINITNSDLFTGGCQLHADSVERAAGWHWNAGALERLVEDDGDAAASATGRSSYLGNRISFRRRETEADVIAVRVRACDYSFPYSEKVESCCFLWLIGPVLYQCMPGRIARTA